MNSYELSRKWFDWCFDNPEKIKPNHTALYFFCIEHCNRLGWQEKFGLPTEMAKSAIGIHSYNTYTNTLTDLIEWGFIKMIQKSKNQYSSNIIALSNFNKASTEALDKAMINHASKQSESTGESTDSINKQVNKETSKPSKPKTEIPDYQLFLDYFKSLKQVYKPELEFSLQSKYETWVEDGWKDGNGKKIVNWKTKLKNTIPFLRPIYKQQEQKEVNYGNNKS